jgi:serine/threonine-protein phosphatase 2A activator
MFQVPRKAILTPEQLAQFQASQTHKDVITYIETLNNSVVGVRLTDECPQSPVSLHIRHLIVQVDSNQCVEAILTVLDRVEQLANDTPPVDNKASRFGNPAFRTFYDKVGQVCICM